VVDDELHAFMASTMTEFLGMVAEKYPPDRALDSPDVFNGKEIMCVCFFSSGIHT